MKAQSMKHPVLLFGSCMVGIAATIFLVDFAQVLGFRISLPWFLFLSSLPAVTTLLLPEYLPDFRSKIAYVWQKYPLYLLVLVGAISRLIFGIRMYSDCGRSSFIQSVTESQLRMNLTNCALVLDNVEEAWAGFDWESMKIEYVIEDGKGLLGSAV